MHKQCEMCGLGLAPERLGLLIQRDSLANSLLVRFSKMAGAQCLSLEFEGA